MESTGLPLGAGASLEQATRLPADEEQQRPDAIDERDPTLTAPPPGETASVNAHQDEQTMESMLDDMTAGLGPEAADEDRPVASTSEGRDDGERATTTTTRPQGQHTPTRSTRTATAGSANRGRTAGAAGFSPLSSATSVPGGASPAAAAAAADPAAPNGAHSSPSPSSSPISARTASSSTSSSPADSPSSTSSPSRRVKVYRLKDDAWIDLGTGTCTGEFIQSVIAPDPKRRKMAVTSGTPDDEAELERVEEGAWLVVKREKTRKVAVAGDGSPVKKGKKGGDSAAANGDPRLDEPGSAEQDEDEDEDENGDDDEANVILRSRVQPYPHGVTPDDLAEEDEVHSVDDNGNLTIDAGGYQRQQDTLIVWTERSTGADAATGTATLVDAGGDQDEEKEMALSFATGSGCSEIWDFIKAARRYLAEQAALRSPSPVPSDDALSSPPPRPIFPGSSTASLANSLPEPTLGSIPAFDLALRNMSRSAVGRERAASVVVRTGVIEKLCKLQQDAEDLESLEDLHALCRVMQQILLLNDNAIFEHVLQDEIILGVVGILEYDPEFPTMRASYRQHLSSPTAFVPVVPPDLISASLLTKIHQTHRLHYLKDIVLARIIEDSTFSMLNSAIYFNEVDIVGEITQNRELMVEVFRILTGEKEASATSTAAQDKAAPTSPSKGKERSLALGPKRTIGPDLPDDLLAERQAKRARVGSSTPPVESSSLVPAAGPDAVMTATAATSESERKLHAMLFLQQLAQMAKNLGIPARTSFYRTMCERGLLSALEGALRFAVNLPPEEEDMANTIRTAALGVWIAVVDLDPADVRAFCLKQGKEQEARSEAEAEDPVAALEADIAEDGEGADLGPEAAEREAKKRRLKEERRTLLGLLICMFREEEDIGVKAQLTEALRILVDVTGDGSLQPGPRMRQEDPEAERFLQYFYDHCVLSLVQPLMDLPERSDSDPPLSLPASSIAILTHLCDLLCFFVSNHTFRSKYLILSTPVLAKSISRILRPKPRLTRHTHLRLAALRFLRACIARSDEFYNRFMIKHDLVRPVLETAAEERDKDNLIGSACLEFFENLRTTNVKALLNHIMERSGETARKLATKTDGHAPLKTFETLIARWEMNNEPPPPASLLADTSASSMTSPSTGATSSSMQRQPSQPGWTPRRELEEESYFNTSDDEDDATGKEPTATATSTGLLNSPSISMSRRKREPAPTGEQKYAWLDSAWNFPSSIVGYGEESDSDDEAEQAKGRASAADPLAGGFIRDEAATLTEPPETKPRVSLPTAEHNKGSDNVTIDRFRQDVTTPPGVLSPPEDVDAPPPSFLPALGSLKRKKEEDEDDDGELGLLAKKRAPSPAGGKATSPPSKGPTGASAASLGSKSSSLGSAAGTGTTKLGGFKIALGGLKSKLGQGKAAGDSGDAAKSGS